MAGNVVSNVKKYYGGQVPVPGQGDSDGKVKVLVEKTTTMEIEGVQTNVDLLYDSDDLTTPVTPQKLGQWTDENYLIVFKTKDADGKVRGFILYALETEHTSADTLVNNATFVAFNGIEIDPGASAFVFTMVEDSSTLSRYLQDEYGESQVKFNLASVKAGEQSGYLSDLIGTDSPYMSFQIVRDEDYVYLNLNADDLDDELEGINERLDTIEGILDELPSDEHGYFNSSLITTPGDGTTTSLVIDNFRISEGRNVHGDNIEFVPTHQEGGVDFGEVYLNPGTYILNVHYTLQWVGNPRGTFLPLVANVGEQPFDFSYGHENILRSTRIVTKTTRGKFGLNFPFDADTPPMGIWVKYLEIAQIASYNHPAVTHDSTLAGSGQIGDPLGVTPAAFGKVKDIPTSISQFRNGDVVPVDGPNGPAKMNKDTLLELTAQNAEGTLRLDAMRYDGGDITTVNDGYVNQLGVLADVTESFPYKHSDEIAVKAGDYIEVNAQGYSTGVAIIAESLGSGTAFIPLVMSIDSTKRAYTHTFTYDCKITISFNVTSGADYNLYTNVLRPEKADIVYDTETDVSNVSVGAVMSNGVLDTNQPNYRYTNDIEVHKGDVVVVCGKGVTNNVAMIAKHSGSSYTPVSISTNSRVTKYQWAADSDCKVVATYDNTTYHDVKVYANIYERSNELPKKLTDKTLEKITSFADAIGGYINVTLGTISTDANYQTSQPMKFFKGDSLDFKATGYLTWIGMISVYYEGSYIPKVRSVSSNEEVYHYDVAENCYLVFSCKVASGFELSIKRSSKAYIDAANQFAWSKDADLDFSLLFRSFCGIGDSLMSGYIKDTSVSPNVTKDCYDFSWLSYLGKQTNSQVKHYSKGGLTAKAWMNGASFHDAFVADSNIYGAYFIALGTNDSVASYPIGNLADAAGTDSFVGYIKSIIDTVHTKAPNAPIFILSTYNISVHDQYSTMLESIAGLYDYCYFVDILSNIRVNLRSGGYMVSSNHFTTLGYLYVSGLVRKLVSDIVKNNLSKFAMHGLYNTEY